MVIAETQEIESPEIGNNSGSIIFVVGKSPMDIMEPILCRKKVP